MKHTLKLFYRNFRKHASINLINLGGLVLSMTVVLILSAYCYSELTTDRHHKHPGESFLVSNGVQRGELGIFTPAILAEHLRSEIPDIKNVVRIAGTWESAVIKAEGGEAFKTELVFADTSFFQLFNYHEVLGDLETALSDPSSIVITKPEALRLFGKTDVIGETIYINNKHLVKITAVIEQAGNNSFLSFKVLVPIASRKIIQPNGEEFTKWSYSNFQTFVQINKNSDLSKIETLIKKINTDNSDGKRNSREVKLIPLEEIYFAGIHTPWANFLKVGDFSKIVILMIVASLILIIALINFVNISSYSLKERLRQTGIFKIIGASKRQVLINVIFESILIFSFSYWMAIVLAEVIHPFITQYTGVNYINELILTPAFIAISFSLAIFLGIITNIIPSIRHAITNPINGLKKALNGKTKGRVYQSSLVIFQFCAAIVLITFTLLVHKQIKFGTRDLGYNDKNTVAIKLTKQLKKKVLKDKLGSLAGTEKISLTQFYPGKPISNWGLTLPINGEDKKIQFSIFDADLAFMDMMNIELVAGRFYSDTVSSDKNKVLINEAFVKEYEIENLSDIAISGWSGNTLEAVGIIKDFHYKSKNHAIGPLVIKNTGYASYCLVEISSNQFADLSSSIDEKKEITAQLSPDFPVEISFMDQAVENMYQSELQFRRTFTFFAGCAIFISCLGILALSLYAGQQRTKEIGIRKVNGAHVEDILMLLNKDFIKWVMIAFIIATPIAFFSMKKWLESFAYKTEISWWIFIIGGCSALLIALFTVSWQSWMAAKRNPVEALRDE